MEKLKEENEKLKIHYNQTMENMREFAGEKLNDYFKDKLECSWEYELEEQRMKKEIQKLKEENNSSKITISNLYLDFNRTCNQLKDIYDEKLKEEIKELTIENKQFKILNRLI